MKTLDNDLLVDYFDFPLPESLIAQSPLQKRSDSKLLLIDRENGQLAHDTFNHLSRWLRSGDVLVVNNTKVLPARLLGKKASGGQVECLLLEKKDKYHWKALVKPGRRLGVGSEMLFGEGLLTGLVVERFDDGERLICFSWDEQLTFEAVLDQLGEMPLPPYIHQKLLDNDRYQTVYAKESGSAAAPTAGLHFTPELTQELEAKGITFVSLTLHVGLGTFRPVKASKISEHKMHAEYYELNSEAALKINQAKAAGARIIAVGTTSCRVLESISDEQGMLKAGSGWTEIFIFPGYQFRCIDGLITNFHLPKSTLLMLISAFSSWEIVYHAYMEAISREYRFFSFGDATFFAAHPFD